MLPFKVLAIDTDILRSGGWPSPTAELEELFSLCRELGVSVCLPEVVKLELEEQHLREFAARRGEVDKAVNGVNRFMRVWDDRLSARAEVPSADEIREFYRKRIDDLEHAWSIGSIPIPPVEIETLIRAAGRRERPFNDKGEGFKDYLIAVSVEEEALKRRETVALLSRDGIFAVRKPTLRLTEHGIQVAEYREIPTAKADLQQALERGRQQEIRRRSELALSFVRGEISAIETFVRKNLAVDPSQLFIRGVPVFIQSARIQTVERLNGVSGDFVAGATLSLSVEVNLELDVVVRVVPSATEAPLTLAATDEEARERLKRALLLQYLDAGQPGEIMTETLSRQADIELTAIWNGEKFEDLHPVSVKLPGVLDRLTRILHPPTISL